MTRAHILLLLAVLASVVLASTVLRPADQKTSSQTVASVGTAAGTDTQPFQSPAGSQHIIELKPLNYAFTQRPSTGLPTGARWAPDLYVPSSAIVQFAVTVTPLTKISEGRLSLWVADGVIIQEQLPSLATQPSLWSPAPRSYLFTLRFPSTPGRYPLEVVFVGDDVQVHRQTVTVGHP